MEASDLRHLALELKKQLEDDEEAIARHLGGTETVSKLSNTLGVIATKLGRAEDLVEERGGSVDADYKGKVIHHLICLEGLLEEIRAFLEGKLTKPLKNSSDAKDILKGLSPLMNEVVEGLIKSEKVIGRDEDIMAVKNMLFSPDDKCSVIPIVGKRGIGKTALAQAVYNDEEVIGHFRVRHWVPMFDIKKPRQILEKICKSNASSDVLLKRFRSNVDSCRYLLVLDGVTQARIGVILDEMLSKVGQGSKVIVTSSNAEVSFNLAPLPMVGGAPYQLGCLSDADSKTLFQLAGKFRCTDEVCFNMSNVPRVIKTVAALQSFRSSESDDVKDPLKIIRVQLNSDSYKRLPLAFRQCLAYCSLFPKDYIFDKTDLIPLWMAQGFITQEIIGDEYFRELQNQGYFVEDGQRDGKARAAVGCRMNYLAYEFVKHVERDQFRLVCDSTDRVNLRHVSFIVGSSWEAPSWLSLAKNLRSLLLLQSESCDEFIITPKFDEIISNLVGLRALDLLAVNCEGLLSFIGSLIHLRYLRVGFSSESLLNSIATLQYLQTLDIQHSNIRELPDEFHRLTNLRHLYTGDRLNDLPPNFGELTSLQTLDVFTVGKNNGLDALANLSGVGVDRKLKICYKRGYEKHRVDEKAGILKDSDLTDLCLTWSSLEGESSVNVDPEKDDVLLKCLQLPLSLKSLTVWHWRGMTFPQWGVLLPHFVSIDIMDCNNCQHLPTFSALPCLKSLKLRSLRALKFIESIVECNNASSAEAVYFPSLEYLMLANLPELEGWSKVGDDETDQQKQESYQYSSNPVFSCLSVLRISGCLKLILMPPAPNLKTLEADNIHADLLKYLLNPCESLASTSTASASFSLQKLFITSIHELDFLLINLSCLKSLMIRRCEQLVSLVTESVTTCLEELEIHECVKLKDITGAFSPQQLEVEHCEELDLGNMCLKNILFLKLSSMSKLKSFPWGFDCLTILKELTLCWLSNLIDLPESIGNLTQLRKLAICYCPTLTKLPEALHYLSNLQQLEIQYCPRLINFTAEFPGSLQRLQLRECGRLKEISHALQHLSVLEELEIDHCDIDLNSGNGTALQGLNNLRSLKLTGILNLKELPSSLESLKELKELSLCSLYNFESTPNCIEHLPQLQHLVIRRCPLLKELPKSRDSSFTLEIEECPELEKKLQWTDRVSN